MNSNGIVVLLCCCCCCCFSKSVFYSSSMFPSRHSSSADSGPLSFFVPQRAARLLYRPDYRKYLSPEILYIPYKWFTPQTPLKTIWKIPKKFQAKAIQGHVPCLNLKKIFQIDFSQYANNIGTPLFRSMRQAQNTDTHALDQLGCVPK